MNNELKPKEVPEDLMQLIRDNFENYPKVKEMRAQQEVAKRRFDLPTVKAIEDKLEHLFAVTLTNYLDAVNNEAEQLNTEAIGLTAKEKKEIDALHVTLHMSLDLIETAIMEINDILHVHDKNLQIEDFATVLELTGKVTNLFNQTKYIEGYYSGINYFYYERPLRGIEGLFSISVNF